MGGHACGYGSHGAHGEGKVFVGASDACFGREGNGGACPEPRYQPDRPSSHSASFASSGRASCTMSSNVTVRTRKFIRNALLARRQMVSNVCWKGSSRLCGGLLRTSNCGGGIWWLSGEARGARQHRVCERRKDKWLPLLYTSRAHFVWCSAHSSCQMLYRVLTNDVCVSQEAFLPLDERADHSESHQTKHHRVTVFSVLLI